MLPDHHRESILEIWNLVACQSFWYVAWRVRNIGASGTEPKNYTSLNCLDQFA